MGEAKMGKNKRDGGNNSDKHEKMKSECGVSRRYISNRWGGNGRVQGFESGRKKKKKKIRRAGCEHSRASYFGKKEAWRGGRGRSSRLKRIQEKMSFDHTAEIAVCISKCLLIILVVAVVVVGEYTYQKYSFDAWRNTIYLSPILSTMGRWFWWIAAGRLSLQGAL